MKIVNSCFLVGCTLLDEHKRTCNNNKLVNPSKEVKNEIRSLKENSVKSDSQMRYINLYMIKAMDNYTSKECYESNEQ